MNWRLLLVALVLLLALFGWAKLSQRSAIVFQFADTTTTTTMRGGPP